jgi:hypothetical protein
MSVRTHSVVFVLLSIVAFFSPMGVVWFVHNVELPDVKVLGTSPWGVLVLGVFFIWPFSIPLLTRVINSKFPARCNQLGCMGRARLQQGSDSIVYVCDVCGTIYDTHINFEGGD